MKIGAKKTGAGMGTLGALLAAASLIAVSQFGCGKGTDVPVNPLGHQNDGTSASIVKGYAGFGSQCASGYNSDPKAVRLELWECPANLSPMELVDPLVPLMLSADCARKTLTVRAIDKSFPDATFYIMPDGWFYVSLDGLTAKIKSDGTNTTSDCMTSLSTDIWGQVQCKGANSDQAKIKFETVMWLNKKSEPAPNAVPSGVPGAAPGGTAGNPYVPPASSTVQPTRPGAPQCKLPVGKCYFHATSSVNQC
jgi:hypothetical protein